MVTIATEAQRLIKSAPLELFKFDTSSINGPVLYFTQASYGETNVRFGGVEYVPVDCVFEGMETNVGGALPRPHIQIASTNGVIQNIVNTFGDLRGCILQRVRTFSRFLDGASDANPTMYYGPDTFRVHRKVLENATYIEWELAANIDQEGKLLPGRQVIRDTCRWRYRRINAVTGQFDYSKVQCPYTREGPNAYFDRGGNPVASRADDLCGRKVPDCELRFGKNSPLPFGGFPGVSRVRR